MALTGARSIASSNHPVQTNYGHRISPISTEGGLAQAGIEPTVSNRSNSKDNAQAEAINGLNKTELID